MIRCPLTANCQRHNCHNSFPRKGAIINQWKKSALFISGIHLFKNLRNWSSENSWFPSNSFNLKYMKCDLCLCLSFRFFFFVYSLFILLFLSLSSVVHVDKSSPSSSHSFLSPPLHPATLSLSSSYRFNNRVTRVEQI